ncbi:gasdermin-E-like isoform X2 [Lineus longissimus]|uniref:gasdermin-E-like isoform X2 n=1 Tax=Lineus longissimus TaxID=88925 RepID=UPI00315D0F25
MFEASIHDFVKQAGEDCLHPVPSLFEADAFKPLQIVVKKNRRFFWQSPKYQTQDFSLEEIIIGQEKLTDVPVTKDIFVEKYSKKSKVSLSGKFGAKIKAVFEVDLSGSDYVHVESNFGDVEKEVADAQKLLEVMKSKKLNLDHSLVKQTRLKHRKVLCVVVGIARTTQDCVITLDTEKKASEEIDIDKDSKEVQSKCLPSKSTKSDSTTPKIVVKVAEEVGSLIEKKLEVVDINESGSVDDQKDKSFTVKAGTPLAFEVYELMVKSDGSIEIMFDPDTPGGFWSSAKDSTDGTTADLSLYRTFAPIIDLKSDQREKFTKTVLHICETPVAVDNFVTLLKQAYHSVKSGERKYSDIAGLKKTLGSDDSSWTGLLEYAGFNLKSDNSVVFPITITDNIQALRAVFEALREMEDDTTQAIAKCTRNLSKALLNLFQQGLDGKEMKLKDSQISQIYADSSAGQELAYELGFTIKSHDTVCPPAHKQQLKGAYRAVYALWGTKEESD